MNVRVQNLEWKQADCCKARKLFDKGRPGLFKLEFFGHKIVALSLKTYFCEKESNQGTKKVSKILSTKLNQFHLDTYLNVCSGVNKKNKMQRGRNK